MPSASSSISGLSPISGGYNADDELASETYDQNGNVIAANGKTFSYDSQNQLVAMNGGSVQIMYDGDGNRVAKLGNGVTTYYLVDDLNPTGYPQVMDELVAGAVSRTYTYGLQRISQDQVISNTWTPSFYGYDGGGNVRTLTNAAGTITDSYDYDAFGNKINSTGTTSNNYLYRGEQYDPDLSLYYLRARYYNPTTGRFMGRDPGDGDADDPATLHKYLYAEEDPIDRIDPLGQEAAVDYYTATKPSRLQLVLAGTAGFATGAGLYGVTNAILCHFYTDASTLDAIAQHLTLLQRVERYAVGCYGTSNGPAAQPGPEPKPGSGAGNGAPTSNPTAPPCMCQPGWHMHHMLPQNMTMKEWFWDHGQLDVDDPQFLVCMPPGAHIGKGGLHPNGWNPEWQAFMDEFPEATKQQVLDQLNKMENEWRFQKPLSSCEN